MAATDQHYRSQKTLDVVFGLSCAAMLLTTLWMFWQDYSRDWKDQQRKFRDVEAAIAEREMIDKMPDASLVIEKRESLKHAREALKSQYETVKYEYKDDEKQSPVELTIQDREKQLNARREGADARYREIKANYDAQMSYYNIAIDEVGKVPAGSGRHKTLLDAADAEKKKLGEIELDLAKAKAVLDQIDLLLKQGVRDPLAPYERDVAQKEAELKDVTKDFDRLAKQSAKTAWTRGDTFRRLPIIDGFASPVKIQQIWLPDLTIDYSFKDVPRYDRCTTCHMGIDRGNYDRETLTKLGDQAESNRLTGKVVEAKKMLERRQKAGEDLGFEPADLPGKPYAQVGPLTLLVLACVLVAAGSIGLLEWSIRLGLRVAFWGLALTLVSMLLVNWLAPRVPAVEPVPLTEGQVTQFCGHPRLDLFVDSNSPHPMEKFGCTICHAGQGSATEFTLASHIPNDVKQEHHWQHEYGWASSHYWDYPMLQKRFLESSCLKCHHQVTDLIRHGNKEEAPKLLKGYNLIKENGCFGCHEIQGVIRGRPVGPDLRLEPSPALEWLSPAEQERLKNDAANPPGTMRKVGPSLRRLDEKVSDEWARKWISSPRDFREDTRMPHFYHLSTNDKKYLAEEDAKNQEKLKDYVPQQNFPATELRAVSHYLLHESRLHLQGKDTYREALLGDRPAVIQEKAKKDGSSIKKGLWYLQWALAEKGLSDREMKDLFDVSKRFSDLALLSNHTQNAAINARAQEQRQLQERLQALHKSFQDDAAKAEVARVASELTNVTAALEALAVNTPDPKQVVTHDGTRVSFPDKDGNADAGRKLFTERGCLACHSHQGTTTRDEKNGTPGVNSDANFGPDLSRIADKLLMGQDKVKARRWLVQWIINPTVYHPRTRMPVTHLSAEQANDVATWLLSKAPDWKGKEPDAIDPAALRALARLNLSKAPGMTKLDVDTFLPADGELSKAGISPERVDAMPRDADERELVKGSLSQDKLLWYVGKRAVGRQGCYGCHDAPGFETAKPIGTGLADWGKKDHDKLAFEDGEAWAKEHLTFPATRTTRKQVEERVVALWKKGGERLSDKSSEKGKKSPQQQFSEWLATVKDVTATVEGRAKERESQSAKLTALRPQVDEKKKQVDKITRELDDLKKQRDKLDVDKDKAKIDAIKAQEDKLIDVQDKLDSEVRKLEAEREALESALLLEEAEGLLDKKDKDELDERKKQLSKETQDRFIALERLRLEKGLSTAEQKEFEELSKLRLFERTPDSREPMEEIFAQALEHHHREGFLHLKLQEPRSYDFNRIKVWDERLRMPQFKFARTRGTSPDENAEAEAREAVMTFVLGLVADPIPLKYVNQPRGDRAAEVLGRQVLDKYNCASCHQIRPGVYEFKGKDAMPFLESSAKLLEPDLAAKSDPLKGDYHFSNTNAWTGLPQSPDRMMAYGYLDLTARESNDKTTDGRKGSDLVRLTDAFRFTDSKGLDRNVRSGYGLYVPRDKYVASAPYGGAFIDLLAGPLGEGSEQAKRRYVQVMGKTPAGGVISIPRGHLPPPLLREGERVQPDWLYKFLLDPMAVRPEGHMLLRMPKFNLSPEESRALVNYFAASSRITNPALGVTAPYVQIDQKDKTFWKLADDEYRARLESYRSGKEEKRIQGEIDRLQKEPKAADKTAQDQKDSRLKALANELAYAKQTAEIAKEQLAEADKIRDEIKKLEKLADDKDNKNKDDDAKKLQAKKKELAYAEQGDLYSRQAYRLLTTQESLCFSCHSIGNAKLPGEQGPNLARVSERLRPEWMEHWIANPARMFPYPPIMSANFPTDSDPLQWKAKKEFVGTPLQKTRATRDLLLDAARLNELIDAMPPKPVKAAEPAKGDK